MEVEPDKALLICMRVNEAVAVVPGSIQAICEDCGAPVWRRLYSGLRALGFYDMEQLVAEIPEGTAVVCTHCAIGRVVEDGVDENRMVVELLQKMHPDDPRW